MTASSVIQPPVTPEMVLPILQEYFDRPAHNLQPLVGGAVAQTFAFTVEPEHEGTAPERAGEYIIRFNATMLVNFEKEAYVYNNFASPRIPIPRVIYLGRLGDVHFAITEKAPGQNLLQIPPSAYPALIPQQIEILDAIHQIPVGDRLGYGVFDGNGVAHEPGWRAHIEAVQEEGPAGDFFANWHTLFQTSFLERDVFDRIFDHMTQLIGDCPEERYLVHGDYGFGNLLAQDGRITAVLDWMGARYGDFLYDVAWLDFWSPAVGWTDRFQQYYRQAGRTAPSYHERILCYQCYITLGALKFYAKAGDKASYDFAKGRILALLDNLDLDSDLIY